MTHGSRSQPPDTPNHMYAGMPLSFYMVSELGRGRKAPAVESPARRRGPAEDEGGGAGRGLLERSTWRGCAEVQTCSEVCACGAAAELLLLVLVWMCSKFNYRSTRSVSLQHTMLQCMSTSSPLQWKLQILLHSTYLASTDQHYS